jgi:hypothetical protein
MTLDDVAQAAMAVPGIESVAIFVRRPGTDGLDLGAAAGVAGIALERLVAAVQDPSHPVARTVLENVASFDVAPMAPGGPALRSHIPVSARGEGPTDAAGVLAVAHDVPLDGGARDRLVEIAGEAAAALG